MIKRAAIFLICLPILHQTLSLQATAEEINIVVEGNGSASSNEANVQNNSNTTVNQSNTATVNNNVDVNSDTGENSTNDNSGDTNITTGDTTTDVSINNENINTNATEVETCCNNDTNIKISGNGENSVNQVNANTSASRNVSQNNSANIYNNVLANSNTGWNSANDNLGDVRIDTGDIKAETNILNKNINNSYARVSVGTTGLTATISGNGENSVNLINYSFENASEINVNNFADIFNNVEHILNTGHNSANGNLGDVALITGDIESTVNIENANINSSTAITTCLCDTKTPENPEPEAPENPSNPNPTSSVQSASGSSSGGGQGGNGHADGNILPVTGGLPLTYLFTIILLLMFLMGLYLRFYSGKSPPSLAR